MAFGVVAERQSVQWGAEHQHLAVGGDQSAQRTFGTPGVLVGRFGE
jgi:hypothetical protein